MPIILALRRVRETNHKFKTKLGYLDSYRTHWQHLDYLDSYRIYWQHPPTTKRKGKSKNLLFTEVRRALAKIVTNHPFQIMVSLVIV